MNHKASNVFQIDFSIPENKREDKNKIHNSEKRNIEFKLLAKIIYSSSMHTIFLFRVFSFIFYFICFQLKLKFNFILLEH